MMTSTESLLRLAKDDAEGYRAIGQELDDIEVTTRVSLLTMRLDPLLTEEQRNLYIIRLIESYVQS